MSNLIQAERKFKEREIIALVERLATKVGIDLDDPYLMDIMQSLINNYRIIHAAEHSQAV